MYTQWWEMASQEIPEPLRGLTPKLTDMLHRVLVPLVAFVLPHAAKRLIELDHGGTHIARLRGKLELLPVLRKVELKYGLHAAPQAP